MKHVSTARVKKSYSISPEVEQFVRRMRKLRRVASDSETLDQLLRESMLAHSRGALDVSYKAYYDSASDSEMEEERTWASFSEAELAELTR